MKYFLAFCIWLPLCYGINYLDWHYGGFVAQTPIIFLIRPPQSWGILFVLCMGAAFMFGRSRLAGVPARVGDIPPDVAARFPPDRIFYVTDKLRQNKGARKYADWLMMQEDYVHWKPILEMFPRPPANEKERHEREAHLWFRFAETFLIDDGNGNPTLKPKSEILDYFNVWEKWVFRYYYAATGTIHDTIAKEYFRLLLKSQKTASADRWKSDSEYNYNKGDIHTDARSAAAELETFIREKHPAHMKKWGDWFFANIEDAFKKQVERLRPEDRNVHGEGGFATRDDINRAARGLTRGPASQQEFED
jgi:hypothetical protein